MEKNNRINQISWINALAIILVVIGHADMTPAYDQLWIKRWIYSFHMPLFVFVSGFLFCYTTSRIADISVSRFLKKKVKQGVEVRVMYDGMGCIVTLPRKYNEYLLY